MRDPGGISFSLTVANTPLSNRPLTSVRRDSSNWLSCTNPSRYRAGKRCLRWGRGVGASVASGSYRGISTVGLCGGITTDGTGGIVLGGSTLGLLPGYLPQG